MHNASVVLYNLTIPVQNKIRNVCTSAISRKRINMVHYVSAKSPLVPARKQWEYICCTPE
jgi:hypothetical protein